jgi:hypothetical protein
VGNGKLIKKLYFHIHVHGMTKEDMEGNDYTIFHGIFLEELDRTTDRLRIVYAPTGY